MQYEPDWRPEMEFAHFDENNRTIDGLVQMCCGRRKVISLVGAGGKTTLMYEMARRCSKQGLRVLVSTTTHIARPKSHFAAGDQEVKKLWKSGTYAVIGEKASEDKLSVPPEKMLYALMEEADVVLLEADGSKGLPCKVPADHEPVILPETSLVIGVMGMSCLGKSMDECCFRLESAQRIFGVSPDTPMSEELAVSILISDLGTRKHVGGREFAVVLNQCDTEAVQKRAEKIAGELKQKGIGKVFLTCFRQ